MTLESSALKLGAVLAALELLEDHCDGRAAVATGGLRTGSGDRMVRDRIMPPPCRKWNPRLQVCLAIDG
jgi:hypothetical protein